MEVPLNILIYSMPLFSRYDKELVELELDNENHLLKLHDTAGQEDYERIRQVIYKEVRTNAN